MKVIFTCGGTAGHVNPALALAGYMRKKDPTVEVLFVGTPEGIERDLVAQAGYDYRGIAVGSLERSVSWEAIRHNCKSAWEMLALRRKTGAIFKEFPADLVVGTGGYASYPMVKYAALRGIPTAVHEANMIPGLTTKMLEKHASRIMVGFEECRALYKHPERIAVTGTPVRGDFFDLTHEEAKAALGMGKDEPLVVSFWGSLGASTMNGQMLDFFKKEKEDGYPFYHIHAVGGRGWETMQQEMQKAGLPGSHKLDVRKYIYDMAVVMRSADLVICRAGASTISEITALAVPTIIVPSPYVANNHQEKNARILAQHGGACLIREEESSGEKLYRTARDILASPTRLASMSRGMAELGILDATERIYNTVMELVK